ncbi:MAG TPA: hypothetical protein VG477_09770, partial [Thermoanaerobaculia bacterium]|nr:hypothetical protein [Thermoanaerobaculia bacterium]
MSKSGLATLFLSFALTNSAAAETVVGAAGRSSSIAVTHRGDLVIVWEDIDDGAASQGVFVRLYDASGRPKGPAFQAHSEIFGHQTNPKVAVDQVGNFVVAWEGGGPGTGGNVPGGDGDLTGVFVQRFDPKGRRLGRQTLVNRSIQGSQVRPAVDMDRSGAFVVAWVDCPTRFISDCSELRAQRFSASGARRGEEREITAEGRLQDDLFLTSDPEGFSLGWTEIQEDPATFKFEISPSVARFTPSGQPAVAPVFRLFDGVFDATGWRLAALASSETNSVALLKGQRNSIQVFSPDGEPVGPRRIVGKRAPCLNSAGRDFWCETPLTLAMNSSGHFAVVWFVDRTDLPLGPARHDLWAQLFGPDGLPLGDRFQVNQDYSGSNGAVAAALSD